MPKMLALGLVSGTARDGIDAALIESDGDVDVRRIAFESFPYADGVKELISEACAAALRLDNPEPRPVIEEAERIVTMLHVEAVKQILRKTGLSRFDVQILGFHGHTLAHRPDRKWSWQIGNGKLLAGETGIRTVYDFRNADIAAGGQGAPLLPVYHRAVTTGQPWPIAVVNLGGVANITMIGRFGELQAFDCGIGNALLDDWMRERTGQPFDRDGETAARGTVNEFALGIMTNHHFFRMRPPKSIDRAEFSSYPVHRLSTEDGAATITAFTAVGVRNALDHLTEKPLRLLIGGGGRHNPTMMKLIGEATNVPVEPIDQLGLEGDALEAEGFAYMAVRRLRQLPISFPGTTGVPSAMTGGELAEI